MERNDHLKCSNQSKRATFLSKPFITVVAVCVDQKCVLRNSSVWLNSNCKESIYSPENKGWHYAKRPKCQVVNFLKYHFSGNFLVY